MEQLLTLSVNGRIINQRAGVIMRRPNWTIVRRISDVEEFANTAFYFYTERHHAETRYTILKSMFPGASCTLREFEWRDIDRMDPNDVEKMFEGRYVKVGDIIVPPPEEVSGQRFD